MIKVFKHMKQFFQLVKSAPNWRITHMLYGLHKAKVQTRELKSGTELLRITLCHSGVSIYFVASTEAHPAQED